MSNDETLDDVFGAGSALPTFKFETPGTMWAGRINRVQLRQDRDYKTGRPLVYEDSGRPIPLVILTMTLATGVQGRMFLRGGMLGACRAQLNGAVPEEGGLFAMTFTHTEPAQDRTLNDRKVYSVMYKPPEQPAYRAPAAQANPFAGFPAPTFSAPAPPAPVAPPAPPAAPPTPPANPWAGLDQPPTPPANPWAGLDQPTPTSVAPAPAPAPQPAPPAFNNEAPVSQADQAAAIAAISALFGGGVIKPE